MISSVVRPLVAVPRTRSKRLGFSLRLPTRRRNAPAILGHLEVYFASGIDPEPIAPTSGLSPDLCS
jgi:hypothetical protein